MTENILDHPLNEPGVNPFTTHMGIKWTKIMAGETECVLEVDEHHFHPGGVVHGGVAYAMVDSGMAIALMAGFEDGENCATIELKISYLSAVTDGTLRCRAWTLRQGARIAFMEAEVIEGDRIIAKANGTFAIIPPRQDSGN